MEDKTCVRQLALDVLRQYNPALMRMNSVYRFLLVCAAAGLCLLSASGRANGQPRTWSVASLPHVDLWFHGLAVTGYEGFGPLRFYDEAYAASVRGAKQELGVYPTALDEQAARFRDAFENDSTFEVFHFLPLYFAGATRRAMLSALETVSRARGTVQIEDATVRFGASVAATVLTSPEQREVLGDFVGALQEEWEAFFNVHWADASRQNLETLSAVQNGWDSVLGPKLASYLSTEVLERGLIIAAPPLGPEGRIFEGDPANPNDNIVAVRLRAGHTDLTLFSAVREMCYPVVRRALESSGVEGRDRVAAERQSSRTAVRCGAMLLERLAPELVQRYQAAFPTLAPSGAGAEELKQEFLRAYPIDPGIEAALARELEGPS